MPLRRLCPAGTLLAGLLLLGLPAFLFAAGSFTGELTAEEKKAAGLDALSADQLDALDRLVAADQADAREQRSSVIAGSLADRHSPESLEAAGVSRLTPEQLSELDRLVAVSAAVVRPLPRERPRLKGSDVLSEQGRLRLHGGVSFTVGGGSGGSFYGASTWVSYYDPATGLGLSVAVSRYSGDGLGGYYNYGYPTIATPARYVVVPSTATVTAPANGALQPANRISGRPGRQ